MQFSQTQFNDFDRLMIKMLDQAYKEPSKRINNISGYKYYPGLSNDTVAVYIDDDIKKLIYVIKGTSNKKELLLDLKLNIANPLFTKSLTQRAQLRQILSHFGRLFNTYKTKYQIYTASHSLGGIKAHYINSSYPNVRGTTFNSYFPTTQTEEFRRLYKNSKLKQIIVLGDPLSGEVTRYVRSVIKLKPPSIFNYNILAHIISTLKKL